MDILKRLPWKRFIKFLIAGGSALAIDFAIYFILTRYVHIPYLAGRAVSLAVAMIWNFSLNRNWTFQARTGKVRRQLPRFLFVMTATSLLSLALMKVGVSYLKLNDLLVIIVIAVITSLINFIAHQTWSYSRWRRTVEKIQTDT